MYVKQIYKDINFQLNHALSGDNQLPHFYVPPSQNLLCPKKKKCFNITEFQAMFIRMQNLISVICNSMWPVFSLSLSLCCMQHLCLKRSQILSHKYTICSPQEIRHRSYFLHIYRFAHKSNMYTYKVITHMLNQVLDRNY